ncbi:hypothetical protein DM860_001734 [Cuscuta australis]|uniref:MADS-box domain-containing protein n=1 Tax=Cuscuta australis TaxID=267555 RepID=A0A328EB46_9ASTE|nr:hypothetical protein DM860_001734 [Cuscuta australis]
MVGGGKKGKKSPEIAKYWRQQNAIVKRAKEICTLCASQFAIIILSIGGPIFTFGDETLIDLFEEHNDGVAPHGCTFNCTIHKSPKIFKLQSWNKNNNNTKSSLPLVQLPSTNEENGGQNFDGFLEKLNLAQLQQLGEKMDGFREQLESSLIQVMRVRDQSH